MSPRVSIITVAYNAAATIGDTIRSVQAQSHGNLEHVIIDGDSCDDTRAIVERMADSNTSFLSEPDQGLYDAMNKGIDRATGDYIGILNADDFYASDTAVAQVVASFADNPGVSAVLGDIAFIDDAGRELRRYDSGRFAPDRTRWGWMPAHPGMYLRRDAYEKIGRYRTDMKIAADFDFVVRAFTRARLPFIHLPEVLVHMRRGGASTGSWRARMTINREVVKACRENGVYTNLPMIMTKYPLKLLEGLR